MRKRLSEKGIAATFDETVARYITDNGYDTEYGARPIKRLIQKTILDKLADKLVRGQIKDGGKIKITWEESSLNITV